MGKKIMVQETEIDWLKIIELAFKKQDWGKVYNLYVYKDVRITCEMNEFNFSRGKARFEIKAVYKTDHFDNEWDNYDYLDYYLENFTIEDFKALVLRKIKSLIERINDNRTKRIAEGEFSELHHDEDDIDDEMMEKFGLIDDYNTIQEIENYSIKSQCEVEIGNQVLELANAEFNNEVIRYCNNNKHCVDGLDKIYDRIKQE